MTDLARLEGRDHRRMAGLRGRHRGARGDRAAPLALAQGGHGAAARVLRGYLTGLPGFTAFFLIVTLLT